MGVCSIGLAEALLKEENLGLEELERIVWGEEQLYTRALAVFILTNPASVSRKSPMPQSGLHIRILVLLEAS